MFSSRRLRVLVCSALAAGLLTTIQVGALASEADAAGRDHAAAHISASAARVHAGDSVRVTGRLTMHGGVLGDRVVTVQHRVHGSSSWATLSRGRTDPRGQLVVGTRPLNRSEDYRLAFAGSSTVAATTSAPVTVVASQQVSITDVSDLHPTAGDIVTITGAAYAGIPNRIAFLQELTDTGWTSQASVRVPDDGSFTLTVRSMQAGERFYRVDVRGGAGVAEAVSTPRTFEVSGWYRLTDLTPLESTSVFGGPQTIGGVVYPQSLAATLADDETISTTYDLDYRCRLLRTTLGPVDGSDADFTTDFTAKVDDARPVEVSQPAGTTQSVTAEISGGKTLQLSTFAASGAGTAAWGNAEVLCLGAP